MRRLFVLLVAGLVGSAMLAGPVDAKPPKNKKKAENQINEAYACFLDGSLGYTYEQKAECVAGVADDEGLLALMQETGEANAANASMTSYEIEEIEFINKKSADVAFNLVVGGEVLQGIAPPGGAVLVKDDGDDKKVWKVSTLTFCNLTALANSTVATEGPCAEVIANDKV
ncbi:MAG TPA: hypothetical protein VF152_01800 [Acidimicrobiia bacterium]